MPQPTSSTLSSARDFGQLQQLGEASGIEQIAAGRDLHRHIGIGQGPLGGGHEPLPRHRIQGGMDARIGDVVGADLRLDHVEAGGIGHRT